VFMFWAMSGFSLYKESKITYPGEFCPSGNTWGSSPSLAKQNLQEAYKMKRKWNIKILSYFFVFSRLLLLRMSLLLFFYKDGKVNFEPQLPVICTILTFNITWTVLNNCRYRKPKNKLCFVQVFPSNHVRHGGGVNDILPCVWDELFDVSWLASKISKSFELSVLIFLLSFFLQDIFEF
jgi:hypothetical protein